MCHLMRAALHGGARENRRRGFPSLSLSRPLRSAMGRCCPSRPRPTVVLHRHLAAPPMVGYPSQEMASGLCRFSAASSSGSRPSPHSRLPSPVCFLSGRASDSNDQLCCRRSYIPGEAAASVELRTLGVNAAVLTLAIHARGRLIVSRPICPAPKRERRAREGNRPRFPSGRAQGRSPASN